ncbi:VHS-domain-containing protein [Rozella allomycis CSF55]|uniref:Vacuolar protein sorting-associated protein 27 n=1 Tax=Rozella allomycis (strain CSF55) TaxID=988480 RepID=A0A4P9YQS8_ROZAC|nr:VHS-domain-containing protein [Rozella allomycis CSF55]
MPLFSSKIDEAVEKATSGYLPTANEDIIINLDVCDMIKSKEVDSKNAMRVIKKRLLHKNPNVQLLALKLTDSCVKNAGHHFLKEIASKEYVDSLVSLVQIQATNPQVRSKALEYIQYWALAFRSKSDLNYMWDMYNLLKNDGFNFPPAPRVDSSFLDTQTAPEWTDSENCTRCRAPFSLTNRKHHCRNCGHTYCQRCSSKTAPLPHFGVNEYVRVCDSCFNRKCAPPSSFDASVVQDNGDADLQKAIQLSMMEYENKFEKKAPVFEVDEDPLLKAAIEASLKDQERKIDIRHEAKKDFSLAYDTSKIAYEATPEPTPSLYTKMLYIRQKLEVNLKEAERKYEYYYNNLEKISHATRQYDSLLESRISFVNNIPFSQPQHQTPALQNLGHPNSYLNNNGANFPKNEYPNGEHYVGVDNTQSNAVSQVNPNFHTHHIPNTANNMQNAAYSNGIQYNPGYSFAQHQSPYPVAPQDATMKMSNTGNERSPLLTIKIKTSYPKVDIINIPPKKKRFPLVVVLLKDYEPLNRKKGEVIMVDRLLMRRELYPQGIAEYALPENIKKYAILPPYMQTQEYQDEIAKQRAYIEKFNSLNGITLAFKRCSYFDGATYLKNPITAKDIKDSMLALYDLEVDEKDIRFTLNFKDIKRFGWYEAVIDNESEYLIKLKILVKVEEIEQINSPTKSVETTRIAL